MARKKNINPIAAALTLAVIGGVGFALFKYVIKPRRTRLKQQNLIASNQEILDAQFEPNDFT